MTLGTLLLKRPIPDESPQWPLDARTHTPTGSLPAVEFAARCGLNHTSTYCLDTMERDHFPGTVL